MTLAIMQLRLNVLNKRLSRNRCRLNELNQQKDAMLTTYTNASRMYKQAYLQLNGLTATLTEQMRQNLTNQLGQLEPILLMMDEKENEIDLEIQEKNSEIIQDSEERSNVLKAVENCAKNETAHYTLS